MAFTYDSSLAAPKDQLRFLVQDTTDDDHFLEDEEIGFIAGGEPNIYRAAAVLCRTLAARINSLPGYRDKHQFDPEKKAEVYLKMAQEFDKKAEQNLGSSLGFTAELQPFEADYGEPSFTRKLHFSE